MSNEEAENACLHGSDLAGLSPRETHVAATIGVHVTRLLQDKLMVAQLTGLIAPDRGDAMAAGVLMMLLAGLDRQFKRDGVKL